MLKRTLLAIGTIAIIISFMAWDIHENKESKKQEAMAKAEFEKVYTVADIIGDAYFNEKPTALDVRVINSEQLLRIMETGQSEELAEINVTDEIKQKRIMDAIKNLHVQKTRDVTSIIDTDYAIDIKSIEEYTLQVSEQKKQIRLIAFDDHATNEDDAFLYEHTILKGADEFFDALNDIQHIKKPAVK